MTKIDKTDLENIKLIVKESKINSVAKIKIKKNDYEIEITSDDFVGKNVSVQKIEKNTEIKAPRSGIIKKIVTLNSQPVEYGDTLIIFE